MIERFEQFSSVISSLYRTMQKIERVEMEKYGLKGIHGECLLAMLRFPQGITAARLSEYCEKDKAAVSRTVADLEKEEMVVRLDPGGIRYRSQLRLTPRGLKAAEAVRQTALAAVQQAGRGLSDEKRQIFYEVTALLADNLHTIARDGLG